MKGEYETDRAWADLYLCEMQSILEQVMRQHIKINVRPSDFKIDTAQATDLISGTIGPLNFAARLRRPGMFWGRSFNSPTYWGHQFTIRSQRDSGTETELSKIMKGFGDWYLYGHVEDNT